MPVVVAGHNGNVCFGEVVVSPGWFDSQLDEFTIHEGDARRRSVQALRIHGK